MGEPNTLTLINSITEPLKPYNRGKYSVTYKLYDSENPETYFKHTSCKSYTVARQLLRYIKWGSHNYTDVIEKFKDVPLERLKIVVTCAHAHF